MLISMISFIKMSDRTKFVGFDHIFIPLLFRLIERAMNLWRVVSASSPVPNVSSVATTSNRR